jgi:hypothetical protein
MRRGGPRRRWAPSHDRRVYGSGRWGPRRVRVTECWSVVKAEEVYTALLKDDAARVTAGAHGMARYTVEGRDFTAPWEVRQNAVWTRGRVFLRCPRCRLRCTRLYIPLPNSWLACRRCWGLTYHSRTLQNYKDSLWGHGSIARMFATTQREWAIQTTSDCREERREQSRERWAKRRRLLAAAARRQSSRNRTH